MAMTKALGIFACVLLISMCGGVPLASAAETLDSSALRLELSTEPFSFRVLERSTGEVLLTETGQLSITQTQYHVVRVTDITKSPTMLHATLRLDGTSDPAQASFTFVTPQILRIEFTYKNGEASGIREEFADQGEHYYGIWEMPFGGNLDNRGADHDFLGMRRYPGVNYSSARAPFYATSRKYGIYVETTGKGHYTVALAGKTSFSFFDHQLRYDIIYGPTYADILQRYNTLAGPPFLPPLWAFGSIWWRDDYHDDLRRAKNAQQKVIEDADRLRELHIPAGAIWLDRPYGTGEMGWGNMDFDSSFPDPPGMISELHDRGMNLLLWIANRAWNQLLEEGLARQYLFYGRGSAADMRNPEAYAWFKEKLHAYVQMGIKGYKIDRGEEDELPLSVENLNAILFPKMAAEGLRAVNGDDFFNFTRNVNDTARKYTAVWNGDTRSTFAGLQAAVKTALRSGAINFPTWGSDTGGYIGVPDKELFARWLEFSAYSPMMEILLGPRRTIWDDYDQELVDIARSQVAAHQDLIPYTRSYVYQATQSGMPVMQALAFAYPDDTALSDMWDEYLFGSELLVAPVTSAGATERSVYLPEGRWLDYNDKYTVFSGKSTITAKAPLQEIPLFVREGAFVPRGDVVKLNNNWVKDWKPELHVEYFPARQGKSEFLYFTLSGKQVSIRGEATKGGVSVEFEDLGTPGTLDIYCDQVSAVSRNGTRLKAGRGYQYDSQTKKLTVPFDGALDLSVQGAVSLFN